MARSLSASGTPFQNSYPIGAPAMVVERNVWYVCPAFLKSFKQVEFEPFSVCVSLDQTTVIGVEFDERI